MPDIITAATSRRAQHGGRKGPDTLDDLLFRFQCTPEVRYTGDQNRRQIKRAVGRILDRFGGKCSIHDVEAPAFRTAVYEWRDEMAEKPAACERTINILNRVLSFGVDRRYVRENQAQGIRFRWQKSSSRANVIWTPGQILELRPHLGEIRDAFEIALWTGLRQGDILSLHKNRVCRDRWLAVTPAKTFHRTGVTVSIPYTMIPPLEAVVGRLLDAGNDSPYLLGRRWGERNFRHAFEKAREAAGLDGLEEPLHFHDLRGTLITWLYEAGCSDAEAASISGHALAQGTARAYVARTTALPKAAFTKLRAYLDEKHDDWYCDTE